MYAEYSECQRIEVVTAAPPPDEILRTPPPLSSNSRWACS